MDTGTAVIVAVVVLAVLALFWMQSQNAAAQAQRRPGAGEQIGAGIGGLIEGIVRAVDGDGGNSGQTDANA